MNNPTINQTLLCSCGELASPDSIELYEAFPRVCKPQCGACEQREADDEQHRKEQIERQRKLRECEARLDCIPPEMQRTRINHPSFSSGLWLQVEGWQPSGIKWLGIVGGAGECKTRCISLLAKRLILDGIRLHWTTAVEFQERVDDLRGERGDAAEARKYMATCKTTGVLVLDDIGKNTWTPAVERHLFAVVDYRKTHDLPILWTSNTPLLEILASNALTKDRGAPLIGRFLEASTILTPSPLTPPPR